MIVFPAIDMRRGCCVRLLQGRVEAEAVYFDDPVAVAVEWEKQGAQWLHLVDLDGAMASEDNNRVLARRIFKGLGIPVQFGGGIRSLETLEELLEAGASRVIVGTAAVENEEFLTQALSQFRERLVIGLDARDGVIATRGWQQTESLHAVSFARKLAEMGVERIVYTDISRDGMLCGPSLSATRQIAEESGLKVIASGGISSLDDLRHIKDLEPYGVEGVIVGKALYEGKFTLKQALQCA
jgi:phosphoribosylformimino-5-aminoimidazole carboxamide ribotide isomerase